MGITMKKLIHLMTAFILMSAVPAHGMQEEESRMQQIGQKGAQYAATTRDYLIQEFNDRLSGLQQCVLKRKCSWAEAYKTLRDVLVVIAALYGVGAVVKKGTRKAFSALPLRVRPTVYPAEKLAVKTGEALQWPGETIYEAAYKAATAPIPAVKGAFGFGPYKKGEEVYYLENIYPDLSWTVDNDESSSGKVVIKRDFGTTGQTKDVRRSQLTRKKPQPKY